jgi:TctA family transporter
MVGSFAINNSLFDVGVMLAFGLMGFVFEENGFPLAPAILGLVLGAMLEESFINSMIMADGNLVGLVNRPIAAVLAVITIGMIGWSIISALRASPRNSAIVANDL